MFGSQILPSWETQWLDFKLIYDQEINVVVVSICILNISFFFFLSVSSLGKLGPSPLPLVREVDLGPVNGGSLHMRYGRSVLW